MNKPLLFVIIGIVILISGAIAYVVLKPSNDMVSEQVNTSTTTETPPPTQTETNTQPGTYIDYSADAIATTQDTKLLFFHASWCPQCQKMEASIEADGIPTGVTVFKVDYDSNQKLREQYGVTLQTTFVKIDDSGNKIESYVSYQEPVFSSVERELLR